MFFLNLTFGLIFGECYIFHEIPNDFTFERAIAEVDTRTTLGKYAAVRYQLNWLPDAYSDEGEWNGPGYCVNHIEVYDSLGNKIFSQLFDGYSQGFSVSEDGMYLFNMSCLSPEWDTNIRYRFTVTNIKTKKVAYQELIENCKLHGGGGEFYPQFYNSNGSQIELTNNHIVGFTYRDNKFFRYLNELKFEIHSFSQNEEKLIYPDGKIKIVKIDSLYQTIKLN